MTDLDLPELKKRLRAEGFEVYRTQGTNVSLAERVRDNLILDSGIAVCLESRPTAPSETPPAARLSIRVTVRAQASHFPGAAPEAVAQHARQLAADFEQQGYAEEGQNTTGLADPSDPQRILDTSYEVVLRRAVHDPSTLFDELRATLAHPRASSDE